MAPVVGWLLVALVAIGGLPGAARVAATTVPATPDASEGEIAPELPPPDLPTANEFGFTFDLRVRLTVEEEDVPTEARVYELVREEMSRAEVERLADRLEIGGEVEARSDTSFVVSGEGQLFVSPDVVQYLSAAEPGAGDLPDDERAISFAREWLRRARLTPPDLGEGRVVSRVEDTRRVVVLFAPAEPQGLLAAYPSISVSLGPDGVVLEASLRWAEVRRADLYVLRPLEEAWAQVASGGGYVEAALEGAEIEPGSEVKGRATFNSVGIAYTTAGPPGGRQYLEPVFVFRGRLRPEGADETYPVRVYVPALQNSGAPVGSAPRAETV